jgi:hypothetical protein
MKKILVVISILVIWFYNNYLLNQVSQKEKELSKKEKNLEKINKKNNNKMMEYDRAIDLEKIKKELEKQGLKPTRYIEYFSTEREKIKEI